MDTTKRTATKAISWQVIGFVAVTFISYAHIGSLADSASLAASSMLSGLIMYFLHEKVWQRINWGKVVTRTS